MLVTRRYNGGKQTYGEPMYGGAYNTQPISTAAYPVQQYPVQQYPVQQYPVQQYAVYGAPAAGVETYDVETGVPKDYGPSQGYAAFANRVVRHGFMRKVFGAWDLRECGGRWCSRGQHACRVRVSRRIVCGYYCAIIEGRVGASVLLPWLHLGGRVTAIGNANRDCRAREKPCL